MLRKQMGEAAINVCKACNYVGAGTVEFLLDADLNFYFLEMNTRLQVEHLVTEEITGLDLVEWQILVAEGKSLPKKQEELTINGHAIEIRLYAEDTFNGFAPDIGVLNRYRRPTGTNIRVDDAFEEGMEIPIYYDPMIAKLVVWGDDREVAIQRMIQAIDQYQVSGIKHNLDFCKYVLKHEAFVSGDFDTNFIKHYFDSPKRVYEKMEEESEVFDSIFATIWDNLKTKNESEFISRPIHGAWKLMVR
jgi:propionyl-CoA carboxylase alpha chain